MSAISDYLETKLIESVLRNKAFTPPTTLYLALFTSATTDAGGGTEVTGGAYARQAITFNDSVGGSCSNSAAVTFPQATANWGTISHIGIYDAATAGNLLFHGAITTAKVINQTDQLRINASDITVTLQ